MAKPTILKPTDFDAFLSQPISLNGSLEWHCEWLVDRLILKNSFNIIGGAPKVGKSLLRSHLLVSAMVGRPVFGSFETKKAQKGLLLAGEEAVEVEEARLRRAGRALGLSDTVLPIQIMPQRGFFFDDYQSFGNFSDWIIDRGFDLVVIDPLIRWHRKNENASGELSPILSNLRVLCHNEVTVIVVHHEGKPKEDLGEESPLGYLLRGTSDLAAIYDQLIMMKRAKGRSRLQRSILMDTRPDEALDPFDVDMHFGEDKAFTFSVREPTKDLVLRRTKCDGPISRNELARVLQRGRGDVDRALQTLEREGLIEKGENGWGPKSGRES